MSFVEPTNGQRILLDGQSPSKITLAGTANVGDPLAYNSGWKQADADDATYEPVLIAGQSGVSGDIITAYQTAYVDFGSGCTATAGGLLYLGNTAGDYSASTGTTKYIIGRMTTTRIAYVWGMREVTGDMIEDDGVDSQHYAADSIDKEHLAAEVTSTTCMVLGPGLYDDETIQLGPVRDACTVVHVSYDTDADPGVGTSVGIKVQDGSTDGSGSDEIDASADNFAGLDSNELTTPYALSAGDHINVVYEILQQRLKTIEEGLGNSEEGRIHKTSRYQQFVNRVLIDFEQEVLAWRN